MTRFRFPYPIKPWIVYQAHGIYNPAYQRFGFSRHNGWDVGSGKDNLSRAPFAGTIIHSATKENGLWRPEGAGVYVTLLSDEQYSFDDGKTAYVVLDFLHMEKPLVETGQHVALGVPLGLNDNTGFSTGPHSHIQARRMTTAKTVNLWGTTPSGLVLFELDSNDANNSFDQCAYATRTYAIDEALSGISAALERIRVTLLAMLTKGR